mgnify:CR=1 FL=1
MLILFLIEAPQALAGGILEQAEVGVMVEGLVGDPELIHELQGREQAPAAFAIGPRRCVHGIPPWLLVPGMLIR